MNLRSAVSKVNQRGMLLVFPINNRKEPASLWSEFFPRTPMRWEWDAGGDGRVSDLWILRERLSRSGQLVYSKWFRGRATLISLELARALLKHLGSCDDEAAARLSFQAREVLDILDEDSPLSTKQLKKSAGLQGRELEKVYTASLKELWSRLFIVAFGEVDEGAFPSIAVGSTRVMFETLWTESRELAREEAQATIDRYLPVGTPFRKYLDELTK